MSTRRKSWGSRLGFLATTTAFAVGLGNIWRFPYITGEYGGAAFVLVYIAFSVLIGVPLLTAEISMGREAQRTPVHGMRLLTGSRTSPFNLIGWLGLFLQILILAYYVTLMAWVSGYLVMIASGGLSGLDPDQLQLAFDRFTSTPGPLVAYLALLFAGMGAVVAAGLRGGVERVGKLAMPLLLGLILVLALRSLTLPGAAAGLRWYLMPDFSKLSGEALLAALGQSMFSIGIAMGVAFGFGSYLQPGEGEIPGNAVTVALADTLVAVLAGLVIFPALFSFGIDPDQGPRLLFVTMTQLFQEMPGGVVFGSLFFLLLLVAGATSVIGALEVLSATFAEHFPSLGRFSAWITAAFFFLVNICVVMGDGPWSAIQVLGRDLFDVFDYLSGTVLLPVSAMLLSLWVAFGWGFERFRAAANAGSGWVKVSGIWAPFIRILIPLAVAIVLLAGFGVF